MFDFIFTFQHFLDNVLAALFTLTPYDPLNGSYYDWITSTVIQYGSYILYIILYVVLVVVVLYLFKVFYYIFRLVN